MRTCRFEGSLLLVAMLSLSGCSFMFMSRAPNSLPERYRGPINCTSSTAAPVLDTIGGGYFVLNGLYWVVQDGHELQAPGILLSAGLATLFIASAATGYSRAEQCSQVTIAMADRRSPRMDELRAFGCTKDTDCRLERICVERQCVFAATPANADRELPTTREKKPCRTLDLEVEALRPPGYLSPDEELCDPAPTPTNVPQEPNDDPPPPPPVKAGQRPVTVQAHED